VHVRLQEIVGVYQSAWEIVDHCCISLKRYRNYDIYDAVPEELPQCLESCHSVWKTAVKTLLLEQCSSDSAGAFMKIVDVGAWAPVQTRRA